MIGAGARANEHKDSGSVNVKRGAGSRVAPTEVSTTVDVEAVAFASDVDALYAADTSANGLTVKSLHFASAILPARPTSSLTASPSSLSRTTTTATGRLDRDFFVDPPKLPRSRFGLDEPRALPPMTREGLVPRIRDLLLVVAEDLVACGDELTFEALLDEDEGPNALDTICTGGLSARAARRGFTEAFFLPRADDVVEEVVAVAVFDDGTLVVTLSFPLPELFPPFSLPLYSDVSGRPVMGSTFSLS